MESHAIASSAILSDSGVNAFIDMGIKEASVDYALLYKYYHMV